MEARRSENVCKVDLDRNGWLMVQIKYNRISVSVAAWSTDPVSLGHALMSHDV